MKGFVLAGTKSGVGKTVATLATIHALQAAGHEVQPAKAGPDFIDPSHHSVVADEPSRTLDLWLEGETGLRRNYHRGTGDICIVEGVMGLYDGDCSSTAMVADALDLPVVLVVDAKAGMESVAATAMGFQQYADVIGRDVDVAGVLAQRAHGGRHADGIRNALPDELEYVGRIPPTPALEIPDRHLGLHMGEEAPITDDALETAAEHIRTDRLHELARKPPSPSLSPPQPMEPQPTDPQQTGVDVNADVDVASTADSDTSKPRVAVADDTAFCFVYPATRERLRSRAEIVTFAPTAGEDLPDCDGVYLPGGYPELHAETLAASPALDTLSDRASDGLPIFGECGGLMVLCESLTTTDGECVNMAGILPAEIEMADRYQALDHVELRATGPTLTANTSERLRGHEFHYSSATVAHDARFAFEMERGDGIDGDHDGLTEYQTLGTYAHVHPASDAFDRFLERL